MSYCCLIQEHTVTKELVVFSKTIFEVDPFVQFFQEAEDEIMDTIESQLLPDVKTLFPTVEVV
jgi:hypothetical protein